MKKLMFLLVLVAIGFMFSGCSDMNQDIMSANTDKIPVPLKGQADGTVESGNGYPVPKSFEGTGNSSHTGNCFCEMDYFITYTDPEIPYYGLVLNGNGILTAANGDKFFVENAEGSWYVDVETYIVYFTLTGDINGGTGRFSDASGIIDYTGTQDYVTSDTHVEWTGQIQY